MNLVALPTLVDNCLWMRHDGRQALVVDPGDTTSVLDAPGQLGLALTGILVTHHRGHRAGNPDDLRKRRNPPTLR